MRCLTKCLIVGSNTTTAFCVRVFRNVMYLICYATPPFALLVITLRPARRQKFHFNVFTMSEEGSWSVLPSTAVTNWSGVLNSQSPGSLTGRLTRKILCWHCLVGNNWKTLRWTNYRAIYIHEECLSLSVSDTICFYSRFVLSSLWRNECTIVDQEIKATNHFLNKLIWIVQKWLTLRM